MIPRIYIFERRIIPESHMPVGRTPKVSTGRNVLIRHQHLLDDGLDEGSISAGAPMHDLWLNSELAIYGKRFIRRPWPDGNLPKEVNVIVTTAARSVEVFASSSRQA